MIDQSLPVEAHSADQLSREVAKCGLYIAAAGFEERALAVMRAVPAIRSRPLLLLRYKFGPPENDASFREACKLIEPAKPLVINFDLAKLHSVESAFSQNLSALMPIVGDVWLDISGLP